MPALANIQGAIQGFNTAANVAHLQALTRAPDVAAMLVVINRDAASKTLYGRNGMADVTHNAAGPGNENNVLNDAEVGQIKRAAALKALFLRIQHPASLNTHLATALTKIHSATNLGDLQNGRLALDADEMLALGLTAADVAALNAANNAIDDLKQAAAKAKLLLTLKNPARKDAHFTSALNKILNPANTDLECLQPSAPPAIKASALTADEKASLGLTTADVAALDDTDNNLVELRKAAAYSRFKTVVEDSAAPQAQADVNVLSPLSAIAMKKKSELYNAELKRTAAETASTAAAAVVANAGAGVTAAQTADAAAKLAAFQAATAARDTARLAFETANTNFRRALVDVASGRAARFGLAGILTGAALQNDTVIHANQIADYHHALSKRKTQHSWRLNAQAELATAEQQQENKVVSVDVAMQDYYSKGKVLPSDFRAMASKVIEEHAPNVHADAPPIEVKEVKEGGGGHVVTLPSGLGTLKRTRVDDNTARFSFTHPTCNLREKFDRIASAAAIEFEKSGKTIGTDNIVYDPDTVQPPTDEAKQACLEAFQAKFGAANVDLPASVNYRM